jgi:hypothetical protein
MTNLLSLPKWSEEEELVKLSPGNLSLVRKFAYRQEVVGSLLSQVVWTSPDIEHVIIQV